jgi:SnoaL-like domain
MKRWGVGLLSVGVAVGLLSNVAAVPAGAQARGSIGFRSRNGRGFVQPGAPRASDLANPPLFSPFSSGTLERNFAIMRATSPNPNFFMGGQLNPQRSTIHGGFFGRGFSASFLDGGFFDGGFFGGYGYPYAYGYPAYGYPYAYGYGGYGYPPERVVIIQREIVVPRDEKRGDTDYYLSPRESRAAESLSDAVADIRKAWLNGDFERLKARIRDGGKVRIYLRGKYKYSTSAADFTQMTRDAMSRIDTISFDLGTPERLDDDRAFVSGKHVYKDPDGEKREVFVSYVLERDGGRWKIVEAGSGSSAITKHED